MNKILIVDDSEHVRFFLSRVFENKGFNVALAVDGVNAITMFETFNPDVVLSDINMPNMNGFELAEYLYNHSNIKITLMTASEITSLPKATGVESIIHKSTYADDLMVVINNFIRQNPENISLQA